jgi:hypothetical protein
MSGIGAIVRDYIDANPAAKPRHIAAALGLSVRQVGNVLYQYRKALKPVDYFDKPKGNK